MPEEITLRVVSDGDTTLHVEADGVQTAHWVFEAEGSANDEAVLKAAELALQAAGWEPDLRHMYMDTGLMVLKFHRKA